MQNLPSHIKGFRAKTINKLIDFCRSLQPIRSPTVRHTWSNHGIAYEVDPSIGSDTATLQSFHVSISGNVASILAGSIRTVWGNFSVTAVTSLTLSGSTAWVYVWADKTGFSNNGISFSNSEPISTGPNYQFPLVKATSSDGGNTFTIADGDIRHEGDFNFYAPINKE